MESVPFLTQTFIFLRSIDKKTSDRQIEKIADKIILKSNIVILTGGGIEDLAQIPFTGDDLSCN